MREVADRMEGAVSARFLDAIWEGRIPRLRKGCRKASEDPRYAELDRFCSGLGYGGFIEAVETERAKPKTPKPTKQDLTEAYENVVETLTRAGVADEVEIVRILKDLHACLGVHTK